MKFTTRCFAIGMLLTSICFCKPATAELVLGFSDDNGASFGTDFNVQVGDSINFGIYLQQTGAEDILTDEGLVSFGLDLTSASTGLGTISNAMANTTEFDFENHNVRTATGFEWEYAESLGAGISGDAILLGSFQFDAIAEGTSLFTVEDRFIGAGPGSANWFTPSFADLDEQIFGAGAISEFQFSANSVSAVPEPSSFLVLSCIAGLALGRRRRRKD